MQHPTSQPGPEGEQKSFLFLKEEDLTSRPWLDYIKLRGIEPDKATDYCREVHYTGQKSKGSLSGIGWQNDSGSWGVRDEFGNKVVIGHEDITTLYPDYPAVSVDVFQGYFDFLTRVQMQPAEPDQAFIILNSASLAKEGIHRLLTASKLARVKRVRTWFDLNQRGEEIAHQYAYELCERFNVGDMRGTYSHPDREGNPCKDLNHWWTDCPTARQQARAARLTDFTRRYKGYFGPNVA